MEEYPVHLQLRAESRSETDASGDAEKIQMSAEGTLRAERSLYVLTYEDPDAEDPRRVTLEMRSGSVLMNTEGPFGGTMLFERGHRFEGTYRTPWGELDMGLFPVTVETELTPEAGRIHLKYQLDIQGSFASMHELQLRYRRKKNPC